MTRDPRKLSELSLHKAVVQHLKLRAAPGVIALHIPNGEPRSKRTAAKLKAMGVLSGAADFLIIVPYELGIPRTCFLEIKSPIGKLSRAQDIFRAAVIAAGCKYAEARSIDSALEQLDSWGVFGKKGPKRSR